MRDQDRLQLILARGAAGIRGGGAAAAPSLFEIEVREAVIEPRVVAPLGVIGEHRAKRRDDRSGEATISSPGSKPTRSSDR